MTESGTVQCPAGWRLARVGDILKVRNGYAFKSTDYRTEGVVLIRQSNLGDRAVDIAEAKRVDACFLQELPGFIVQSGDLLIGMSGSLGKIAEYQHSEPALQNQRTGLLLVSPDHDAKFAKFVLKFVEPQIMAEGKGIAVQNVSAKEIENCKFPLPPLPVQRRIVAEIEKQFTRLEAGVNALKRVQANLKRYRAAVLKAACEGKLVPTEAELQKSRSGILPLCNKGKRQDAASTLPYETGEALLKRILAERREKWHGKGKYKEPVAPDTMNLPKLHDGWVWATAEQITDENRSITYGVIKLGPPIMNGVKVLRSSNVRHLRLDMQDVKRIAPEIAAEYRRTFLKGGEILITVRGTLGGVVVVPPDCAGFNISREVAMLAMIEPQIAKNTAIFVGSASLQEWLLRRAKGIAYTGINIEVLKALPIPIPPLSEQKRIVAEVERRLSMVDELETLVSANLARATRLRQAILQKAFEGKLA